MNDEPYICWHKWLPIVRALNDKGMDPRDISEETGISVGAVRRKLRDLDVQKRKGYRSGASQSREQAVTG